MAIATVYTCDISGYSSSRADEFYKVQLTHQPVNSTNWQSSTKLWYIHEPVATRLGLSNVRQVVPTPPPPAEELLLELIRSLASEAAVEAINNR